jgi:hypothetical protein
MTRTMYDAIYADDLPSGGDLYAGYIDGDWPDDGAIAQRFSPVPVVGIATSADTDGGTVGDGPPDNGTWPEWIQWVVRRRAAGVDPTINTNRSTWEAGIAAFEAAGVAQPHWWIAAYVDDPADVPVIPAGAVAQQYYDFGDYDVSVVADYWPGVDPEPAPTIAAAAALEEDEDEMSTTSVNGRAGLSWAAGSRHVVQVGYDPAGGNPTLRMVLVLTTGPLVVSDWTFTAGLGTGVYEIPEARIPACRGVILEWAADSEQVTYDATAV